MANEPVDRGRRDTLKVVASLAALPLARTQTAEAQEAPGLVRLRDGRAQTFDDGWRFWCGEAPGAERPEFDDHAWRVLDLPHDWSVDALPARRADENGEGAVWGTTVLPVRVGPFDTALSRGGRDTGWFVGGTGWYRKRFSTAGVSVGRRVEIEFDGVYMNSDVWLNGHLLGTHPYGYTAFVLDLTPHLRRDGDNVLAVRVRNDGRNSRWYSGSGIYRHVWIHATTDVRVATWGVFVTTPEVSKERALVRVSATVENSGATARELVVSVQLQDGTHLVGGRADARVQVPAGGKVASVFDVEVASPRLWSAEAPHLYQVRLDVAAGGANVDTVTVPFGIRRIDMDARQGLRVNGESVKLRGACLHHDNGLLGACAIDRAEERRVELMKAHGFNAIRTSHNPPSRAFLDACDRVGMFVMDEAFDQWEEQKNGEDYHLSFADWWRRDIEAMVLRDRNHPSVILWSIGNEIPERTKPRGVEVARNLADHVRSLDPTRPVTAAINGAPGDDAQLDPAFAALDVGGYNYLDHAYEPDHERHPDRVMVGTESFPLRAYESWMPVARLPYVIGDFVWTGMDHLGESGIGNAQLNTPPRPGAKETPPPAPPAREKRFSWPMSGYNIFMPFPWFNCYCGDIDLIGQAKPQWYYRRVLWGLSPVEMLVRRPLPAGRHEVLSWWGWSDELQSWTWPGCDGQAMKVRVHTRGDEVALTLNGREVARKPVSVEAQLTVEFDVPYVPGTLAAVAFVKGATIGQTSVTTAGAPAGLRIRADRQALRASRDDLAYLSVEVVDQQGRLVPDAVVPVALTVTGAAELAAAGSANPKDVASFRATAPRTFHGRALAIVRPLGQSGVATVRAEAPGFAAASARLQIG